MNEHVYTFGPLSPSVSRDWNGERLGATCELTSARTLPGQDRFHPARKYEGLLRKEVRRMRVLEKGVVQQIFCRWAFVGGLEASRRIQI